MSEPRPDKTKDALLRLRGATRRYGADEGAIYALRGIDLDIAEGEMIALMGASGSGKSTLLNVLGCLDRLSEGSYLIAREDTGVLGADQLAALRRARFGFVFQRYNLLAQLSALANVEVPAIYAGVTPQERHRRAFALLERLGLADRATQRPNELSGGEQQRVSIARALMNGGAIILADEPTGALDSANGREVMALLEELNRQGHTIVIATHDSHVAAHARRIVELSDGAIVSDRVNKASAPAEREELPSPEAARAAPSVLAAWRELADAARTGVAALFAHRTRSALTLLGVVVGIVLVTAMVAVGESYQRISQAKLTEGLNLDHLDIVPGYGPTDPSKAGVRALSEDDAAALERQPEIKSAAATYFSHHTARYRGRSARVGVWGVPENYLATGDYEWEAGAGFSREDMRRAAAVGVITARIRQDLFDGADPLNEIIYVGDLAIRIIGVTVDKPGGEQESRFNFLFLPATTYKARLDGAQEISQIEARVRDISVLGETEKKIFELLSLRHGKKDVWIYDQAASFAAAARQANLVTALLGAIGVLSLLVGGVGVMNIMLVTVSERAREIGVRIAVGARQSDISRQFLIEAIILCLIGAALALALCFLLSLVAGNFLPPGWEVTLSPTAIFAATICAILTGLIFGYFPARNAAHLDPVEALARD